MKRKGIAAVALAVIILSIGLMLVIGRHRQEIRIYINREDIHYIVANIGMGSQRLNYREHQEILDRIVTMVNGEYRYKKTWNHDGRSGGGPYCIRFVNKSNGVEYELQYVNGYLAVSTNKEGHFYLYEKKGEQLLFDEFEAYLRAYGEFDR